ncbi:hypothetical protein EV714DRAFT_271027 [Schizophyllum commune]
MPDRAMRLPHWQELVDAIVAHIDHPDELKTILHASLTVYLPQICLNLHRDPVQLNSERSCRRLLSISELSSFVLPNIWHIEIDLRANRDPILEKDTLSTVLSACTGLQSLHLSFVDWAKISDGLNDALHKVMQLPTLEALHLEWIVVTSQAMAGLAALRMPPRLKTMLVRRVTLLGAFSETQPSATATQGERAPVLTKLVCDHGSLPFARMLYRERPYPFGALRELTLTSNDLGSVDKAQQLLSANPHVEQLTLEYNLPRLPGHTLSNIIALRSLSIWSVWPAAPGYPSGVVALVQTLLDSCTHTLQHLTVRSKGGDAARREAEDVWRAMDAALCRFETLKTVHVYLAVGEMEDQRAWRPSTMREFMSKTDARGVLRITEE